jgi:hypothetical protein
MCTYVHCRTPTCAYQRSGEDGPQSWSPAKVVEERFEGVKRTERGVTIYYTFYRMRVCTYVANTGVIMAGRRTWIGTCLDTRHVKLLPAGTTEASLKPV